MEIAGFNLIDLVILAVIGVSVLLGLYRGFISGVLSLAALVGSAVFSFFAGPELAAWLQGNETLVRTLQYYTDAGSRIRDLDLSLMTAAQAVPSALAEVLEKSGLPEAFQTSFIERVAGASGSTTVAELLSQTIVSVSLSILSFLICFAVAYALLSFVVHLVNYVFELPALRHLDALIGGAFGFVRGVLLVVIFFSLVPIVLAVAPVEPVMQLLETSRLAGYFDSHLIMTILCGF